MVCSKIQRSYHRWPSLSFGNSKQRSSASTNHYISNCSRTRKGMAKSITKNLPHTIAVLRQDEGDFTCQSFLSRCSTSLFRYSLFLAVTFIGCSLPLRTRSSRFCREQFSISAVSELLITRSLIKLKKSSNDSGISTPSF